MSGSKELLLLVGILKVNAVSISLTNFDVTLMVRRSLSALNGTVSTSLDSRDNFRLPGGTSDSAETTVNGMYSSNSLGTGPHLRVAQGSPKISYNGTHELGINIT